MDTSMEKIITNLLCYLFIAKTDWTKHQNGVYKTSGAYWWNPLFYIIGFIAAFIVACEAFYKYFVASLEDMMVLVKKK